MSSKWTCLAFWATVCSAEPRVAGRLGGGRRAPARWAVGRFRRLCRHQGVGDSPSDTSQRIRSARCTRRASVEAVTFRDWSSRHLSRSEFDEMLERALDGIVEGVSLDRMWEATRGNVLFARELVADIVEAGELRQIHGVWRWTGGVGPAPRLQGAIAGRLDGLADSGRGFLELLSVGEPLALRVAEQMTSDGVLDRSRTARVDCRPRRGRPERSFQSSPVRRGSPSRDARPPPSANQSAACPRLAIGRQPHASRSPQAGGAVARVG